MKKPYLVTYIPFIWIKNVCSRKRHRIDLWILLSSLRNSASLADGESVEDTPMRFKIFVVYSNIIKHKQI